MSDPLLLHHQISKFQFIGLAGSFMLFGVNCCLYAQLITLKTRRKGFKYLLLEDLTSWIGFLTLLSFSLATTHLILECHQTLEAFTIHMNHSGGPMSWLNAREIKGAWLATLSSGLSAAWVLDLLLFYQCYQIYSTDRRSLWILIIPFLFIMSSLVSGIYIFIPFESSPLSKGLPHFPLCAGSKLLMTGLIVIKLLRHKHHLENALDLLHTSTTNDSESQTQTPSRIPAVGQSRIWNRNRNRNRNRNDHDLCHESDSDSVTQICSTIVCIIIESYSIYAIYSIIFISLYSSKNEAYRLFSSGLSQAGVMSHILVTFRATQRRNNTLTGDTNNMDNSHKHGTLTPIRFSQSQSQSFSLTLQTYDSDHDQQS